MATDLGELQNRFWGTADQLETNPWLTASEYAPLVLGLDNPSCEVPASEVAAFVGERFGLQQIDESDESEERP